MFSMTNLLLETAKDNLAYTQNTFITADWSKGCDVK